MFERAGEMIKIFAEQRLSDFLDERLNRLRQEVQNQDTNYLLNVNETSFIDYLVNRYQVELLVFYWDQISVSYCEKPIPAELFPPSFHVRPGKSYPRQVITYHLPFSGDKELLKCQPSRYIMWTKDIRLEGDCVCFDVINWQDDAEAIKREADNIIGYIRRQAENVSKEVLEFNSRLEKETQQLVQARKAYILKQENLVASLGVPVRKAGQVPPTFSIPITKKNIIVKKPDAPTSPFMPEPTLDEEVYQEILKIIYETGIEMERHPSIYKDKDREVLRDHFIMVLSPHFESATGETFNKSGKTDILIRHEKQNIFIAECKFWKGIKIFYDTIDQLLGYLTWRDSKAAIVCFVKNKELDPVLKTIEQEIVKHSCFIKYYGKKEEGWFMFEFHLKDDPTRSVKLAVLCFHFP